MQPSLALLPLLFFVSLGETGTRQSADFLFNGDPYVLESRTPADLDRNLQGMGNGQIFVVMFYANWCTHCHQFAPTISDLALTLECHRPQLTFGAFECSVSTPERVGSSGTRPSDVCRDYRIDSYPTLLAFTKEGWEDNLSRVDLRISHANLSIMTQYLATTLRLPELLTENCTEPLHEEVAADRRVQLKVTERYPRAVWDHPSDARLHDAAMGLMYLLRNWVLTNAAADAEDTGGLEKSPDGGVYIPASIAAGLLRLLRASIAAFPGDAAKAELIKLHDFVESSYDDTDSRQRKKVTEAELQEYLTRNFGLYGLDLPKEGVDPFWAGCTRVTCGTWTLMHFLSIAPFMPQKRRMRISGYNMMLETRSLVDEFFGCQFCRTHFLTAFDEGRAGRLQLVKPPRDQSDESGIRIWLWRFHNMVTLRTGADKSARHAELKTKVDKNIYIPGVKRDELITHEGVDIRFPPPDACPTCRTSEPVVVSAQMISSAAKLTDDDWDAIGTDGWDLSQIEAFLVDYYWRLNPSWGDEGSLEWDGRRFVRLPADLEVSRIVEDFYKMWLDPWESVPKAQETATPSISKRKGWQLVVGGISASFLLVFAFRGLLRLKSPLRQVFRKIKSG